METNPHQPEPTEATTDTLKSSEPSTPTKNSDDSLAEHLGIPNADLQNEFDQTQKRIQEKRDRYFGKSSVQPVDQSKLNDKGRAHRASIAKPTPALSNVSQLSSILGRVAQIKRPGRGQALPFEEAQQVVRAIYENDLANRERVPIWTEQAFKLVDEVTKYFIGDPRSRIPLSKSLFVYGPVGVGKTYLFRMMATLCEVVPLNAMRFRMVSTKRLMRTISDAKSLKPLSRIEQGDWLIDDLASEKKLVRVYGDTEDPIDHLIMSVYEQYIDNGKKTHFTSNKQPDEMEARYGTRAYDRFCEMTEALLFPGNSLRIDPNLSAPHHE